jgi:hypothetical protein
VTASGGPAPGYRITRSYPQASCEGSSEAVGDAYRCFAGNVVIDPCWVQRDSHFVTCLTDPWDHGAVRVHVTEGYSSHGRLAPAADRRHPWGAQTATVPTAGSRLRCVKAQGATGQVSGRPITYYCSHRYVLTGGIDEQQATWTAHLARPTVGGDDVPAGTTSLTRAWFGKQSRRG